MILHIIFAGDKGGRLVLFDKLKAEADSESEQKDERQKSSRKASVGGVSTEWKPYFQFKSHDAEFDYLKSVEIEEKINQITFMPQVCANKFVLSANDKTIKLWKVGERSRWTSSTTTAPAVAICTSADIMFPKLLKTKGENCNSYSYQIPFISSERFIRCSV